MPDKESLAFYHQEKILAAADKLFLQNGVENTTVEAIAKEAQYSKATIYVYLTSKEEIFYRLVYQYVLELNASLKEILDRNLTFKEKYLAMCREIVRFQEWKPIYFEGYIGEINVALENPDTPKVYFDIYRASEAGNLIIQNLMDEGIKSGLVRSGFRKEEINLFFWSSLSGIIRMASQKQDYIKRLGLDRNSFLMFSFLRLLDCLRT